jgi:hypothetical protein
VAAAYGDSLGGGGFGATASSSTSTTATATHALSDEDDDDDGDVNDGRSAAAEAVGGAPPQSSFGADDGQEDTRAAATTPPPSTPATTADGEKSPVLHGSNSDDVAAAAPATPRRQASAESASSHVVSGAVPNAVRVADMLAGESREERQVREILDNYYGHESVEAVMASFREENERLQEQAYLRQIHDRAQQHLLEQGYDHNGRRVGRPSTAGSSRGGGGGGSPARSGGGGGGGGSPAAGRAGARALYTPAHPHPPTPRAAMNREQRFRDQQQQLRQARRPQSAHTARARGAGGADRDGHQQQQQQQMVWAGYGDNSQYALLHDNDRRVPPPQRPQRPSTAHPRSTGAYNNAQTRSRRPQSSTSGPASLSSTSPATGLGSSLGTAQYHGNTQAARVTLDDVAQMLHGYREPVPPPESPFTFHPKISKKSEELLRRRGDYVPLHLRTGEITASRDAKRERASREREETMLTFRPQISRKSEEICSSIGGRVRPEERHMGHLAHIEQVRAASAKKHDNGEVTHRPRLSKGTEKIVKDRGIAPIHERLDAIRNAQEARRQSLQARNDAGLTFKPALSRGTEKIVGESGATFDMRLESQRAERAELFERLAVKHAPPLTAKPEIDPKSRRMAIVATREGRREKMAPLSPKVERG